MQTRLLSYFGLTPTGGPGNISPSQTRLESAAREVTDVYCVLKGFKQQSAPPKLISPPNLASPTARNSSSLVNIRCFCQSSIARANMVQCTNSSCGVWQHAECVGMAIDAQGRENFKCEQCRAALADPFWDPGDLLLPIARLKPVIGAPPVRDTSGEVHPQQSAERAIYLNDQQLAGPKSSPETDRIQIVCLLLEDSVPCRYHWPRNVTLRVNAMQYRPYGRSTTTKMGINQRDEAATVASLFLTGRNTIEIHAAEAGTWLLFLQRAKRRTLQQVKNLMAPKEEPSVAINRVKHALHGGDVGDDAIAVSSQVVSLKDPMSGQRMTVPARFTDASGLQAFDLDSFLFLAQRNRKWQDPTTLKNSTVRQLQVDCFMEKVLLCVAPFPDITEVEINDEGKWRPEGTSLRWFSIEEAVDVVRDEVKTVIKGSIANGGASPQNGASPEEDGGVLLSDSESDEEEELRKAADAVRPAAALIGQKRKAPSDELEVIDLVSDSEEEEEGPRRPQPAAVMAQRPPSAGLQRDSQPPNAARFVSSPLTINQHQQKSQDASAFSDATSPKQISRPSLPATAAFLERQQQNGGTQGQSNRPNERTDLNTKPSEGNGNFFGEYNDAGAGKSRLVIPLRPGGGSPRSFPPLGGDPHRPFQQQRLPPTQIPLRVNVNGFPQLPNHRPMRPFMIANSNGTRPGMNQQGVSMPPTMNMHYQDARFPPGPPPPRPGSMPHMPPGGPTQYSRPPHPSQLMPPNRPGFIPPMRPGSASNQIQQMFITQAGPTHGMPAQLSMPMQLPGPPYRMSTMLLGGGPRPPPQSQPPRPVSQPPPPTAPPSSSQGTSAGGVDETSLSQSGREALQKTREILASDPSLVNEVNVDDWLN